MSDVSYVPSFFYPEDKAGQGLTVSQLEARRRIAIALASRNRPYPKTIGEGLTALGEGLGEGIAAGRLSRDEAAQQATQRDLIETLQGKAPGTPATPTTPQAVPRPAAERIASLGGPGPEDPAIASATASADPLTVPQASQQPQMSIDEWLARVARNESGGRKDAYSLVGERSRRGDYPYGKYQVMGENVPVWTKKYLGQEMTPDEFLANPKAQDQVARARGSEYVAKYGPVGAAAAWFAGEKGMNDETRKDTLGTHVAEYKRRFNLPLVSRDQVAAAAAQQAPADAEEGAPYRVASLGDTAPNVRDDVTQAIAGPPPQPAPAPGPVLAQARPTQQQQLGPQRAVDPTQQLPAPGGTSTPSTETIPPRNVPAYPDPGGPPPQPQPRQLSDVGQRAFGLMNDDRLDARGQAQAKAVYEREEKNRQALEARDTAVWQSQYGEWNKAVDAKRTYELGAPEREITQKKERAALEKDQREQQVAEAFRGMDPKQVEANVAKSHEEATKHVAGYRAVNEARNAFKIAVPVTGAFADQRLAAMKAATLSGAADYSKEIQATEVFRSSMAPVVASALKATVGSTQISNADREFAEKAAAGAITLDEGSIRRLLDITQRAQMIAINRHQDLLGGTYGRINPQLGETLFGVDLGIPQDKVQLLRDNPDKKKDFDEKYGTGAADYVERRHQWRTRTGI